MSSPIQPVIVSPKQLTSHNIEQFDDPSQGNCTWHTLVSAPHTNTNSLSSGIAVCQPKIGCLRHHRHKEAEIYYIISGEGIVHIDGVEHHVSAGSTVFIPGDAEHAIFNKAEEELKWFYVFATDSFGDIVYRFTPDKMTEDTKAVKGAEL
ncbi:RmlC-like cupin [Coleophoma crateriformis]|uniref:RmlC-like cupin n=1 Tax=Coleophoma crateriformis TaxID=565419 RepID=A0A3D8RQ98_9HELO|nr:RmlC-like cupin [Coleophoma crateriformis]